MAPMAQPMRRPVLAMPRAGSLALGVHSADAAPARGSGGAAITSAAAAAVCAAGVAAHGRSARRRARQSGGKTMRFNSQASAVATKPEEDDDSDDDIEIDGPMCSIWLDDGNAVVNEELLAAPWAGLIDKVATMSGSIVRRCTKGAKQVATLGPKSASQENIERLFLCGVDVFRLNFSHGSAEEKTGLVERIRNIESKYMHPICILADMQGPKQRCGKFETDEGVVLKTGQTFRFDLDPTLGTTERCMLPHPEILLALQPGKSLLLDDGKLKMRVKRSGCMWEGKELMLEDSDSRPSPDTEKCPPFIECIVEVGGALSANKGVNTPDVILPISPITPKDKKDILFACKADVDWIALSFVQKHQDMQELRELINSAGGCKPKILAKIEKPSAVQDLDMILEVSDGVMVARGDLGVEMNPEEVPFVQKDMIAKAHMYGKPVIVATQMLESMISCPTPTRAECSDVANAILDGCDAVMLSGETAVGKYSAECVEMQRRVIQSAERSDKPWKEDKVMFRSDEHRKVKMPTAIPEQSDSLVAAAAHLADDVRAKAIVCFTVTGATVMRLAQLRPNVPIIAACPCLETARWLSMLRGVYATSDPETQELAGRVNTDGPYAVKFVEGVEVACRLARQKGLVTNEDDKVVILGRLPLFTEGALNVIHVADALGPQIDSVSEV